MNPHPLLAQLPTNPQEADTLISKMGGRGHSKKVLEWRDLRFQKLGFTEPMATFLAHTHIDLHVMEDYLSRGCEHTVAVDILLGTDFLGDDATWNWQGREEEKEEDEQE